MDLLWDEMSVLKHLRDDVIRRRERKMDKWLQNVDALAREVEKLRKEINETRRGGCPSKSRLEVHKKVIEILEVVAELKRIGNCNVLEHRIGAAALLEVNDVQRKGDGRSTETVERFLSNIAREKPLRFSSKDVKSFTSNFVAHLGHGGYGEVYKGEFPNGVLIAVKVLKDNVRDVVKRQFMAEVGTMGRTYHRNLVRLYGYCFEADMKALVYEFMEKGSLDKILYENHLKLEWKQLYDIATETAKGLSYLHENCHKRIIHCDIKAGNVLIDSNLCPKVADFGLAKLCNRDLSHFTLTRFRGTPGYAAPEVWMPLPVTYKCDVYSFGMLLFEILGRKKNYNKNLGMGQKWFPRQVWEKFENGQLEDIIRDCGIEDKNHIHAKTLSVVALWCAQYVPQNRPSMSTVVKILEGEIQAADPPNPFPHMVTAGVASMITIESTEPLSSMVSSKVDIISKGNPVGPKVPISFSCVSSEDSPVFTEWQDQPKSPIPEPTLPVEKKNQETKVVVPEAKKEEVISVVLMVYMHCEACAQEVAKYLRKMKGVQTATTDLERSQVTVKGVIDPQQLVDYVYKKTNKRAMIVKVESEKIEEPKVTVEAELKRKQEVKFVIETKSEHKTNKHVNPVKPELERAEEAKATARSEQRKKQGRGVAETFLEKKPIKRVVTVINESDTEEEKEIVHTEPKKNQEEDAVKAHSMKRREERKEGVGVVRTKLERKKEENKEDNMGYVKPKHEKRTQVKKEEENGAAKKLPEVKEVVIDTAKLVPEKEEDEIMVKPDARKKERDRIEEMPKFQNVRAYMKEIPEEGEEERDNDKKHIEEMRKYRNVRAYMKKIPEEGEEERDNDKTLDQKVINSKADKKIKENPQKENLIEERGSEMNTEGKENIYYEDPPQFRYDQMNNEYYHGSSSYAYATQYFSDENPNAWCSIQ